MEKIWEIRKPEEQIIENICKKLKCSRILATILSNRNINSYENASTFLNCSLKEIRDPFLIKDLDIAVDRIYSAIKNQEKILIFGDYDVDGITATTILFEFFKNIGTEVLYYIPHRIEEGYSLKPEHINSVVIPNEVKLVITVDCGVSSHEAVKTAKSAGIDVIVTDHHNITDKLPEAAAVVNPKRADCPSGLEKLAGVGVAFYLLIYLRKYLREKGFWKKSKEPNLKNACDLVALGTIADIVPLVDENRILTKVGLDLMSTGRRIGLKALFDECKIKKPSLDADDVAYRLAPRLNAAGRMDHAKKAVELLLTKNIHDAAVSAKFLSRMNSRRQEFEQDVIKEILNYVYYDPQLLQNKTIVLANETWHVGILGIVASKLVKRYMRPVILISTQNGIGKGSGRSIPEFDLYEGLQACSEDLTVFGGHAMAAGLSIKKENINRFKDSFEKFAGAKNILENYQEQIHIDYELNFDEISENLIDEIESLQPFGNSNPEPLFLAKDVKVKFSTIVGKNHRRLVLTQPMSRTTKQINAIHFNIDSQEQGKDRFDQIAFHLRWNYWNDKKTPQIVVIEI